MVASFDWDNNVCFVCGHDVPGLHVQFRGDETAVSAEVIIHSPYQGFEGIVHGGILAGMLDDAMWHAIHQHNDDFPMTAELTVRYLLPVKIGERLTLRGQVTSYHRRLMVATATISDAEGTLLVRGEGRFMPPVVGTARA